MTTEQTLAKILKLCKNNGTTLDELMKLPVLDADGKIPAAVLRIVGALSAGAVIESGDNANGYYVRFADGTQMCWGTVYIGFSASQVYADALCTFPVNFVTLPIVVSGSYVGATYGAVSDAYEVDLTTFTVAVSPARSGSFGSNSIGDKPFTWLAIGCWAE